MDWFSSKKNSGEGAPWREVGATVAQVAPLLGGILGGPVGAIAGAAGSLLASFLGVNGDPASVARALANPETLLKLSELEARERAHLLDWQTKQLEADVANTRSAREREVELARIGHRASWATTVVAAIVIIGFFGMLYVVVTGRGQDTTSDAALMLLGVMGSGFGAVLNYYLGSSLGSAQKNNLISRGPRG